MKEEEMTLSAGYLTEISSGSVIPREHKSVSRCGFPQTYVSKRTGEVKTEQRDCRAIKDYEGERGREITSPTALVLPAVLMIGWTIEGEAPGRHKPCNNGPQRKIPVSGVRFVSRTNSTTKLWCLGTYSSCDTFCYWIVRYLVTFWSTADYLWDFGPIRLHCLLTL